MCSRWPQLVAVIDYSSTIAWSCQDRLSYYYSFSGLLPFGTAAGDVIFIGDLDDSSTPQNKDDFGGIYFPFFGASESILHVSITT